MKIAIIGAGFTGLTAAYRLIQQGHQVTIFERDELPGGLALGFQKKDWKWSLENYYHHWFVNDDSILTLAKELNYPLIIKRPKTSVFIENTSYQLDSPLALLRFNKLSLGERIRMGAVLGFLRLNPFWQPLEKVTADAFLSFFMGTKGYDLLWKPQLKNKFGAYYKTISLAWFWARIKKRTASLAYPQGGFLQFALHFAKVIQKQGGKFLYKSTIETIYSENNTLIIQTEKEKHIFDKVIVTLNSQAFTKLCPSLPDSYIKETTKLHGLGALVLVLRLRNQFLVDNTYWLSICDPKAPIMAIVEHTNFMNKKYYNNEHIVYIANYLPSTHEYFALTEQELLQKFDSYLEKIHPQYKKDILDLHAFKAPFAQPIIPVNYSHHIPSLHTPIPGIFLANMQQVYPWDRGTNYAVALGEKVAAKIS